MVSIVAILLGIAIFGDVPPPPGAIPAVHTSLGSSVPAADDTLAALPPNLELRFTGPIDVASSRIEVVDGTGNRISLVASGREGDERALTAPFPALGSGGYRVEWRTVAADGHPVEGTFVFYLSLPDDVGSAEAAAPELMPPPPPTAPTTPALPVAAALFRGAGISTLAMLAGLLVFATWIAPSTGGPKVRRLTLILAWGAVALLAGHALAWYRYMADPAGGTDMATIFSSGVAGWVESIRILLAGLALWAIALARRPRLGAVFAVGAVVASGFAGHSLAYVPEVLVPARAIHIAAFTVWVGGLLILLATASRGAEFERLTRTVSTLSLAAVALIAVTGLAHVFLFPTGLLILATSLYGALLLGKVVGLGALIGLGARNRFRIVPRLPDEAAAGALRRSVAWEVGVMAGVLLLTGALVYVPVPTVDTPPSADIVLSPD